jgi:hypothetical protein
MISQTLGVLARRLCGVVLSDLMMAHFNRLFSAIPSALIRRMGVMVIESIIMRW